jgi:hypothetical protein
MTATLKDFEEDEKGGVWQWLGVTSELLKKARKAVLDLPSTVFVRSGDALQTGLRRGATQGRQR